MNMKRLPKRAREATINLTIRLPVSIRKRVRRQAESEGVTETAIVVRLLREGLR